jgi:hypothetical protein
MTTPTTVKVVGVLVDPNFLCQQTVSSSETVDTAVGSLWKTVSELDGNPTSEVPQLVQVALGEIGPSTPFKILTCFHGCQRRI